MTKRSLSFAAVALLACASQQKASQATYSTSRDSEDRATVVQPSSLSPEQVRLLQRSLVDRGFAVDLSGRFDQATQTALSQFQRARGLPATGNLNPPTIDALGLDPGDVMPVRGETSSPGVGTSSGRSTTAVPAPAPGMAPPSTPNAPPTSTMPGTPAPPGTPAEPGTDTRGTSTPTSPPTPPGGPDTSRPGY